MKKSKIKIPPCKSYKTWTDCGYEYDCEYQTPDNDIDVECGQCICVTAPEGNYTGLDPRTGKKFKTGR